MLTMTRTRTQTTLTKLGTLVANVHGELEFLEGLINVAETPGSVKLTPEVRARLQARERQLAQDKAALYATLRQFDADIDPLAIGSVEQWQKRFGKRRLKQQSLISRYCANC